MKYCRACNTEKQITADFWYMRGSVPVHPCKECMRAVNRARRARDAEIINAKRREMYQANPDRFRKQKRDSDARYREDRRQWQQEYRTANRDVINAKLREQRRPRRAEINARNRLWHKNNPQRSQQLSAKRRALPQVRILDSIGRAMRDYLSYRGSRKRASKETILGWTMEQLVDHLSNLFEEGMSLDNYGEWHVDHVVAKSHFDFDDESDPMFRLVWCLNNLAPLWAKDNQEKSNRLDWKLPDHYRNEKLRAMYAHPFLEIFLP